MRKPRNMWEFCGELFLFLGAIFFLFGVLSRASVLKTDPGSHGDPGVVFPIVGGGLLIVGLFSLLAGIRKEKRRILLLETGMPVTGEIEAVKENLFTKWGSYHPYVIYFTYEVDGVPYKGKSGLFWTLPPTMEHKKITVYLDADHPKRCALKL